MKIFKTLLSTLTLFVCCFVLTAQKLPELNNDQLKKQIEASRASLAEMQRKLDSGIQASIRKMDSAGNARNIQNLNVLVMDRKKSEKKKAFRNLFIGLGFFTILLIAVLRNKKK